MNPTPDQDTALYQKLVTINLASDSEWVSVDSSEENPAVWIQKIRNFPAPSDALTEEFLTLVEEAFAENSEILLNAIRNHAQPEFPVAIATSLIKNNPIGRVNTLKGAVRLLPQSTLSDSIVLLLLDKIPLSESPLLTSVRRPSTSQSCFSWISFVLGSKSSVATEKLVETKEAEHSLQVTTHITRSDYLTWLDHAVIRKFYSGSTLAMFAAKLAPLPIVRIILDWQASLEQIRESVAQDPLHNSLLHFAVQNPDERVFRYFVQYQKRKLVALTNAWGHTAAHLALSSQRLDRAMELIRVHEALLITEFPLKDVTSAEDSTEHTAIPPSYLLDHLLACMPYTEETLALAIELLNAGARFVPIPDADIHWADLEINKDYSLRANFDIHYRNQSRLFHESLEEYGQTCMPEDLDLVNNLKIFLKTNSDLPYPLAISVWRRNNESALRAMKENQSLVLTLWGTSAEAFIAQHTPHSSLVRFYPAAPKPTIAIHPSDYSAPSPNGAS